MGTGVRQQCTAADRKRICELQLAHKDLTQEKLTALIADQLKLPNINIDSNKTSLNTSIDFRMQQRILLATAVATLLRSFEAVPVHACMYVASLDCKKPIAPCFRFKLSILTNL